MLHSFLSLGRLHIPVFGLFAAAGLMCAMALGQWTARLAHVDPDGLWDTCMVSVLAAFVLSRGLLVIENLHAFLAEPVLVLELPSLTKPGMFLTVLVVIAYAGYKRLPLLPLLDALAPCGALLWAFLELAGVADGPSEGMPTSMPWAVESSFGHVHPVEIYSAIAALVLCIGLLWLFQRASAGQTSAFGLIFAGLLLFVLDFFRLPAMIYDSAALDPIQNRALLVVAAGTLLLIWAQRSSMPRVSESEKGLGNAV
jgi:phosphatidylglycerol:prolipoprotein diacylglycerol transferase